MQPPRGMHDLLPQAYRAHQHIVAAAFEVSARYGFSPMTTPLVESVDVFCRSLGDVSDIVSKEMYEVVQKGKEKLVIRPEGTAGIARAVLSNGLTQSLPLKFISAGAMFRYERPQKGRLRQFHQISAELFGIADAAGDIELITMAYDFLKSIGLEKRVTLELNTLGDKESRDSYRTALVHYFSQYKNQLSKDSLIRLEKNPLRILDSKDEGDKELIQKAPQLSDHLNEASRNMFHSLKEGLDSLGLPYKLNPHLVRGLDYYCHAAFEYTSDELGAQSAVLAGGRYDGLISTLGGPHIPGVGWACGIERLALMLEELPQLTPPITMITGEDSSQRHGLKLAHKLRESGFHIELIFGGNFGKKLKKATKLGAKFAILLGSEELEKKEVTIKNLEEGTQCAVPFDKVNTYFQKEEL